MFLINVPDTVSLSALHSEFEGQQESFGLWEFVQFVSIHNSGGGLTHLQLIDEPDTEAARARAHNDVIVKMFASMIESGRKEGEKMKAKKKTKDPRNPTHSTKSQASLYPC